MHTILIGLKHVHDDGFVYYVKSQNVLLVPTVNVLDAKSNLGFAKRSNVKGAGIKIQREKRLRERNLEIIYELKRGRENSNLWKWDREIMATVI